MNGNLAVAVCLGVREVNYRARMPALTGVGLPLVELLRASRAIEGGGILAPELRVVSRTSFGAVSGSRRVKAARLAGRGSR